MRRELFFKGDPSITTTPAVPTVPPPQPPSAPTITTSATVTATSGVTPAPTKPRLPPTNMSPDAAEDSNKLETNTIKSEFPKESSLILNSRPTAPLSKLKELDGYVGFANLPNQVYRKAVKKGFDFTLMVVGMFCGLRLLG